jgi:hypothetical protein
MNDRSPGENARFFNEDLALSALSRPGSVMAGRRFIAFFAMSATILVVYLAMNFLVFPGYPVVAAHAESDPAYEKSYPPFRMSEYTNYSIAQDILKGRLFEKDSLSHMHPIGFPFVAAPLTRLWGAAGPYYTNAFILWIAALVFFFLLLDFVPFPVALGATAVLAFASPNLFYASSAFAEPLGQLLVILSLFLFHRAADEVNDRAFYFFSGFAAGLALFIMPILGCLILLFLGARVFEYGKWFIREPETLFLAAGFAVPFAIYMKVEHTLTGSLLPFLFSTPDSPYNPASAAGPDSGVNMFLGFWRVFLDFPHGAVSLMPLLILVPSGFLVMRRGSRSPLTLISAVLILAAALGAAAGAVPVGGDGIGARGLVPVIPLFILPLAFLWEEGTGEKVWIAILGACTIFMCTFGWWAGNGGALEDRAARAILLARHDRLERTVFSDPRRLTGRFASSLRKHDMTGWLRTLSPESLAEINGVEREVFESLARLGADKEIDLSSYIGAADPKRGITLRLPDMRGQKEKEGMKYY